MPEYHLAEAEKKFAQLIWKHEPLPSRRLVELAAQELAGRAPPPTPSCAACAIGGCFRTKSLR